MKPLLCVGTLWLLLGAHLTTVAAQQTGGGLVSKDSSGYAVVDSPNAILDQFDWSLLSKNQYFVRAEELLTDERFSLTDKEQLKELKQRWSKLWDALKRLEKISIVVHSWGPDFTRVDEEGFTSLPKVSVLMEGPTAAIEELEKRLTDETAFAAKALKAYRDAGKKVVELEPGEPPPYEYPDVFDKLAVDLERTTVKKVQDMIVLSNAPTKSEKLIGRLEKLGGKPFAALSEDPVFKQLQSHLGGADVAAVRGLIVPVNCPELTTELLTYNYSLEPKSLVAAGFRVWLQPDGSPVETPTGKYRQTLNWDCAMTFTQPASEFGKLIESYRPLQELPVFPYAVTKLTAFGFDLRKRDVAHEEIVKLHRLRELAQEKEDRLRQGLIEDGVPPERIGESDFEGLGDFEVFGIISDSKKFNPDDILDSCTEVIEVSHPKNDNDFVQMMEFYRANDPVAMEKFFRMRLNDEKKYNVIVKHPYPNGQLFGRPLFKIRAQWLADQAELDESDPNRIEVSRSGPLSDEIMSREIELFLNDQWMVQADHFSMRRFLATLDESKEKPAPQTFELLLKTTSEASGKRPFFKIIYKSDQAAKYDDDVSIETKRIYDKYSDNWDKQIKILDGQPDRYGLRNPLESRADVFAAVGQLVEDAWNDAFGTSMNLLSAEENRMHMFGQIFSVVDDSATQK